MRLQHVRVVLLTGIVAILHVPAAPRAAGQGVYFAAQPGAVVQRMAVNGSARPAERMSSAAILQGSNAAPGRSFLSANPRVAVPANVPQPVFRMQPLQEPHWREQSDRYFSVPVFDEMESSFRTLDTPFASEVRLSLGTAWRGRIRLAWFADSRALDSVMLGPPVAGMVNAPKLAGGGTLQYEDDVYGVQLMIRVRRRALSPEDRDALRGLQRAYRTGRGFFLR
jgi:hypothetical protein